MAENDPVRILHLEDNEDDVALVARELRRLLSAHEMRVVETESEFHVALDEFRPELILADYTLPTYDGMTALDFVKAHGLAMPFIFVSGTMGEEFAIEAMRRGATDYVLKNRLRRLVPAIERALREDKIRRQAQESEIQLTHTKHLLNSLINHSPAMISVRDMEGRLLLTNQRFDSRFGINAEPVSGKGIHEIMTPELVRTELEHQRQVISRNRAVVQEHVIDCGDQPAAIDCGGHLYCTWLAVRFPLHDDHGRIEAIGGIDINVTDRKVSEERLREQANVLDQASDAIFVMNAHGGFTYCNQAAIRICSRPREEVMGSFLSEMFPAFSPALEREMRQKALEEGTWKQELEVRDAAGERLWLDLSATRVTPREGGAPSYVLICSDITEKKELAEQFLHVQRMENLGMLAAGIAHDLNNVLSPIGMVATLLRSRMPDGKEGHMLDILEQSTNRGAGLVQQILSFAQGVSGELREVQPKHLLRDIASMVEETFPKEIQFEQSIPRDLWPVKGDPTQIHQVLLNLCVNARDAMPDGGQLSLSAENITLGQSDLQSIPGAAAGDWVKISVVDSGHGMPPEVLGKIWSPFFSTKAPGEGTGLGLSTVRGIVQRHGGFIDVASTEGEGSQFEVFLPAVNIPVESASPFDSHQLRPGQGERILIVDDEALICDIAAEALADQGYQTRTARDGEEALRIFMEDPEGIDVLLTDLSMPKLSGAKLVETIKNQSPSIRVLVMSGGNLEDAGKDPRLQSTVSTFLKKPVGMDELVRAIGDVLAVSQTAKPSPPLSHVQE